ncbi:P-loop containing nucleoside triphosphate hydrolase protein [Staphylotrichum tortipilum]|uniref:P-loop containing nucleoside triphosphate hydrolase protein n=1 Tax=Staphylotrichum tortipilum TaxID=2831512 RepID=A0AAN6MRD6_9PEZI|nr:P-loop containing nucleoside triphosphate hydrolase protein [Staphylotrichum longicolle]
MWQGLCAKDSLPEFQRHDDVDPPEARPRPTQGIILRAYQEECIQTVLSSLEDGQTRLGVSLATGSGKTVIFTQLIGRVKPRSEMATQTLILAHRRELVEQAARHCKNAYPDKAIDIELGKLSASGLADITVASLQSLISRDRFLKFDPERFKLVLVDEAHHIVAPGYLKILAHFGLRKKQPNAPSLVGVSATFSRHDGLRLGAVIDEIVYHKDYVDMISEKWLSEVIFTTVESRADLSGVKRKGKGGTGEFDTESLSRAVNKVELNDIIVRSWLAKAAERKSTLVFCVDISHVEALTERFQHSGVDARYVTGETKTVERSRLLDEFKRGEYPVLINCGVFTEGTDIPNIDCVVLARPTRSQNLLIQMIGRGMRLHSGKENCHIIDMVAGLETGIVTTPTLFGLDPNELVSESSADQMLELASDRKRVRAAAAKKAAEETAESQRHGYNLTFTEYDSVYDLIADTSGEKHIRSISPHAWVQVGPDKFILSGPNGTYLRLARSAPDDHANPTLPRFRAWEVRALPPAVSSKSPFAAPRELAQGMKLTDVLHGCDTYAAENYPRFIIASRQAWRRTPPSDGQLKMLNKLRPADDQLTHDDVTRGQAADMITKIKHGARGRWADYEAKKKRARREAAGNLLEALRARCLRTDGLGQCGLQWHCRTDSQQSGYSEVNSPPAARRV